jgi:hypothetical protein
MNDELKTVRDDLAFLRTIAEGGGERGGLGAPGAGLYGSAGLLYGLQTLGHFAQVKGVLVMPPLGNLLLGWLPTVIFLILMTVVIVIDRKRPQVGAANRAVSAAFSATGLANLALIVIFAAAAVRNQDFKYWLFHPAVVFVVQGAVWFVVFSLRKRAWMALVSVGWLVAGIAMGLLINRPDLYLLIAALGLFAFMMVPGFHMMRQALRPAR